MHSYSVVEKIEEVEDCLAIAQKLPDGDERLCVPRSWPFRYAFPTDSPHLARSILFVKPMQAPLTSDVVDKIKLAIRQALSTRHVPAKVIALTKIPYTTNGKRLEVPTKKLVNGVKFESLNLSSAEDPDCLRVFVNHPELRLDGASPKAKL